MNGNATIFATFDDAYNTPWFGPLVEYVNIGQTTYGALVVYESDIDSNLDRWALVLVDLSSTYITPLHITLTTPSFDSLILNLSISVPYSLISLPNEIAGNSSEFVLEPWVPAQVTSVAGLGFP